MPVWKLAVIDVRLLRKIAVVGIVVLCFAFAAPTSHAQTEYNGIYQKSYGKSVGYPISTAITLAPVVIRAFWGDPIGNTQAMQLVMTFWMDFDINRRVDVNANTQGVKNIVFGLSGMALMASFLIGGIRMVASRRRGLQEGLEDMGQDLGKWFIFSTCFPGAIAPALAVSDKLSKSILDSFGATSSDTFIKMTSFSDSGAGPILMAILAIVAMAGSIMQLLALIIRALILPIAVGLTPLFAALSFSEVGRSGLHHLVSYTIAALAFKPVCALLYAVVLWNVTRPSPATDPNSMLPLIDDVVNVVMIALTGLIAPTLVRMLVPAVSQAGGAGGGQLLAGAASAAGAAVGAIGAIAGTAVGGGMGSLVSGASNNGGANKTGAGGGGDIASAGASTGGSGGSGGSSSGGSSGGDSGAVATGASGGSGGSSSGGSSGAGQKKKGRLSRIKGKLGKFSQRPFDRSWTGRIEGAERGATRGRRWVSPVSDAARRSGGAISSFESMLEASAGHPGQVRR